MTRSPIDPRFSAVLRELLDRRGVSFRALAARTYYGKSYLHELASGTKAPTPAAARRLDEALDADGRLAALLTPQPADDVTDDEVEAWELARRVAASDVGTETLTRLERAVDALAMSYPTSLPADLLPPVRRHLDYVGYLVDARKTLDQHRRLLVIGGWLSLIAATVHIDLRQHAPAAARLETAAQVAEQAGHAEIQAWCLETRAWSVLTDGNVDRALDLSRQAQAIAPTGSSVHIQATAQEGRAWARMRRPAQTRDALARLERLVSPLPVPDCPEHHYRYDPDKALAYTATTLAWVGDPAAEEYARAVVRQFEAPANGTARPRRVASARLDLSLALLASGKPDEAASATLAAITSGRIVASNWWRATEIVTRILASGASEAADLREAYLANQPVHRRG